MKTLSGFCVIAQDDTVQSIAADDQHSKFNKIWIYPASAVSAGKLTANGAAVFIGEKTSTGDVTPDVLDLGDGTPEGISPFPIELPQGESKLLREVLIQGAAGDGVWFKYWPA